MATSLVIKKRYNDEKKALNAVSRLLTGKHIPPAQRTNIAGFEAYRGEQAAHGMDWLTTTSITARAAPAVAKKPAASAKKAKSAQG